jgi:hypothetical protein
MFTATGTLILKMPEIQNLLVHLIMYLSQDKATTDGVWVGSQIHWTLNTQLVLHFTTHYHTQTSVPSVLLGSSFQQQQTLPFF